MWLARCVTLGLVASIALLTGCITDVWTGANLVYNRHNVYKTLSDFQLGAKANRALYQDQVFKGPDCLIDLAVINGDVLLAGHVPTDALRQEAMQRIKVLPGKRRLFDQLSISSVSTNELLDHWITTKIRGEILGDSSIDPHGFKVVTSDQIVYLMGDVIPSEAGRVIHMARSCDGVRRVVTLFKYYHLSDKPK
ncbi:MAG: BON domain-containing protein [Legionellales bacterium]|nr:BON domain-containing protein [Legionellales bacterium]